MRRTIAPGLCRRSTPLWLLTYHLVWSTTSGVKRRFMCNSQTSKTVGLHLSSSIMKDVCLTRFITGNTTTNCDNDLHGPQSTKYCADGGVYYLQQLAVQTGDGAVLPMVQEPPGFDNLGDVGLEPQVSIESVT